MERLSLSSFVATGYRTTLFTYDPALVAPAGVEVLDARMILPETTVFSSPGVAEGSLSYANFSDRFRYHLLEQRGGWWFDLDMISVRLMPEPKDLRFASTWEDEWGECANGCAMWSEPNDTRMSWLRAECDRLLEAGGDRDFLSLGPGLVQRLVREQFLAGNVAPWWEFCPYPWRVIERTAPKTSFQVAVDLLRFSKHLLRQVSHQNFRAGYIRPRTRAIHLHNEIWKAKKLDKNAHAHPLSVIGRLRRRYERPCQEKVQDDFAD